LDKILSERHYRTISTIINKTSTLLSYHSEVIEKLGNERSRVAARLADYLFTHPIITVPNAARALSVSYPSVKKTIEKFISLGILQESEGRAIGRGKRPALFIAFKIIQQYEA